MRAEDIGGVQGNFRDAVVGHSEVLTSLAVFAITTQILFLASAWLLPAVSEFDLMGDYISELALGRFGFVQIAAFFISGLGLLALA